MGAALHFDFREHWRDLKRGRPGRRFQDRYERARTQEHRSGAGQRIVLIAVAFVCLAIAVVLSVIPGPAIPFYFLTGGLLATESKFVARFMDWIEVKGRKIVAWGKRRWRSLPTWARVIVVIVGGCCSAGLAYLSYQFATR